MKKAISPEIYELLLRWSEGELNEDQAKALTEKMEADHELKRAAQDLASLQELGKHAEFRFQPFFVGRVMHQIEQNDQQENPIQALQFAFQRLALPAFAVMIVLLVLTFIGEQSLSLEAIVGTSNLDVEDVYSQYFFSL
ncbi:MAG: hypothetical protein AAFQ68_25325 [Bacteroidota bacterium]